jgi:hypothetical protein
MENSVTWFDPLPVYATSPEQVCELGPGILTLHTPMHERINTIKNEIDRIAPAGSWDDAKKITNPYEYIFLSLQRRMHRSIAATVPLSRSYFKMIEIWDVLGIRADDIRCTVHSAEGPGGFLEAIQTRTVHTTRMLAMTLRSTEHTIPGWRKSQSFLTRHPNVHITYGADGTGNLYNLDNQDAFATTAHEQFGSKIGADLYTADGGFDFSADFNGQENTVQRLLIAEALAGIATLRPGATMILKMFDTKHRATLELLWLLGICFDRTGFIKPHTSRPANSERYWVGCGFRGSPPVWITDLLRRLTATDAPVGWNQLFVAEPYTSAWIVPIQAFQERIEAQQFHTIEITLNLIKSPSRAQIADLLQTNIRNSRRWCQEHDVPLNGRYVDLRDEQVTTLNLEEVLAPFPVLAAQTRLPTPFLREQMRRGSSSARLQSPPTVLAWRSALPASVLGRSPSQTVSDRPTSEGRSRSRSPSGSH